MLDSSNNATYSKRFHYQEVHSTRIGNFGVYPGDFRLQIWSLPDYPGELTALSLMTRGHTFYNIIIKV